MATRPVSFEYLHSQQETGVEKEDRCQVRPQNDCLYALPWSPQSTRPQRKRQQAAYPTDQSPYSDADLAKDMNALTFEERERISEDIHGVSGVIEEPEPFVRSKIKAFREVIDNLSAEVVKRAAWDRAVFLRPSLKSDRDLALLFLRAKRFEPYEAVQQLFQFYEAKQYLWGEDKLTRRYIGWDDLTELEKSIVRDGMYVELRRNRDAKLPNISYCRVFQFQPEWPLLSVLRAISYRWYWNVEISPESQRTGVVAIIDTRGPTRMPALLRMQNTRNGTPILETLPIHHSAIHILFDDPNRAFLARNLQSLLSRNKRIRMRVHLGSWLEIQYSLRTYGIDIPYDFQSRETDNSIENPFSQVSIDKELRIWHTAEEQLRQSEAVYLDPASPTSLYPNPQDILLGKNRRFAATWPGTVGFTNVIHKFAPEYLAASSRSEKTQISHTVLNIFKTDLCARFLMRKETHWEAVSDADARFKISQALRDEARQLSKQMKTTLDALHGKARKHDLGESGFYNLL